MNKQSCRRLNWVCGFDSSYSKINLVTFWIFGKNQLGDDTWGLPSRGSFFSEKHAPRSRFRAFLAGVLFFLSKKHAPFQKTRLFVVLGPHLKKKD